MVRNVFVALLSMFRLLCEKRITIDSAEPINSSAQREDLQTTKKPTGRTEEEEILGKGARKRVMRGLSPAPAKVAKVAEVA